MTILITNYIPIHLQILRLWCLLVYGFRSTPKKKGSSTGRFAAIRQRRVRRASLARYARIRIFSNLCPQIPSNDHRYKFRKYFRTQSNFTPQLRIFFKFIENSLTLSSPIYSKSVTYLFADQSSMRFMDNFNTRINPF